METSVALEALRTSLRLYVMHLGSLGSQGPIGPEHIPLSLARYPVKSQIGYTHIEQPEAGHRRVRPGACVAELEGS